MQQSKKIAVLASLCLPLTAFALKSYPYPPAGNDIIGHIQYVYPKKKDRIYQVARRYNVGYYELIESNPEIPRRSRLDVKERLTIPTEYILPNVERKGIVINLPELRLYYYNDKKQLVQTSPIAIGRFNWKTPVMTTKVIRKYKDPVWVVPKSIKESSLRKGIHLPDVMPAGPKNPLGKYMMRLGNWSYLIHGTNAPNTIGKRASSGCMRMFPESVEALFKEVPIGTTVQIINEPVKVGWRNDELYLEAHEALHEAAMSKREERALAQQAITHAIANHKVHIDWRKVDEVIEEANGLPTVISSKVSFKTRDYEGGENLLHGNIEYVTPHEYLQYE